MVLKLIVLFYLWGNWSSPINMPFNTQTSYEDLAPFDGTELIATIGDTLIVISDRWGGLGSYSGYWGYAISTDLGKTWDYENFEGGQPSITTWGDTVYIPYIKDTILFIKKSTDCGLSWLEIPVQEAPPGGEIAKPSISVWENNVYLAFEYKDTAISQYLLIAFIKSTDGGTTWSTTPVIISDTSNHNNAWTPHIKVWQNNVYIQWRQSAPNAWGCQIYLRKSTDGGNSWEEVQRLTDEDHRWTDGSCLKVWQDNVYVFFEDWVEEVSPPDAYKLKMKKSTDGGNTWGIEIVIEDWDFTPEGDTVIQKFPWADVKGDTIILFWQKWYMNRSSYGVIRKPAFKLSTTGGLTWSEVKEFGDTIYQPYNASRNTCKMRNTSWYYIGYVVEQSSQGGGAGDVVIRVFGEAAPTVPIPVYPVDSTVVNDTQITFIWRKSQDTGTAGIKEYKVLIDTSIYTTPDTFLTVFNLEQGWHIWQVKAIDSLNVESEFSDTEYFKVETSSAIKEQNDKIIFRQKQIITTKDKILLYYISSINCKLRYTIYNIIGQKVKHGIIDIKQGNNVAEINIKNLKSGIFVIKISKKGNKNITQKIIKF